MVFRVLGDLEKIAYTESSIIPVMGNREVRNLLVPGLTGKSRKDAYITVATSPVEDWYKVHSDDGWSVVSIHSYNGKKANSDSLYVHESQFVLPSYVLPRGNGKHIIKAVDLPDMYADSQFVLAYYGKNGRFSETVTDRMRLFSSYFSVDMIDVIKAHKTVPLKVMFSGNICLTVPPSSSSTPPAPHRP